MKVFCCEILDLEKKNRENTELLYIYCMQIRM